MEGNECLEKGGGSEARLSKIRRRLHQCPELDFALDETSTVVEEVLTEIGIPWKRLAGTGIAAFLEGKGNGRTVLLRADMDGLPVDEENDVPWRSANPGQMHACGHDVHMACLLGAARKLSEVQGEFSGKVLFVFQPAEETSGGALPMLEEGLLDGVWPDGAFALHCDPFLPAGTVGVHSGSFRAASDMFDCVIRGRGTHGAEPHNGDDVIAIACRVISALHELVGRTVPPSDAAVLSVGSFHAGSARNILPDRASFSGILRTLDEQARVSLKARIRRTVMNIPDILGAVGEIQFTEGYPVLRNDPGMAALVMAAASEVLGAENVIPLVKPSMGVDDFAYFLQRIPGCYFMLGTGKGDGSEEAPLHSPRFFPDERCLAAGADVLVRTALSVLGGDHQK
ncbi:MAG: M20 family metallopeptidase [Synergistaceae bacterium]|nr:M20 family metallopeptidase [Synergistaceae bacterium]